ncbi:hypothetical protein AAX26_01108 [Aliarcobacter thereius]|uniref:DUF2892 domain-containing protein n=2 Tax=Aliarcobacter thereius TaxID=544718 RepID=A0A1C0B7C1_9BACT|nr:DUF2892 domain-containing protein [Aliarcobacter thereius]OCL86802.1 hypothetical protein AAX26_01108 [Aliarcobacter thereius]OCL91004.1 hypothetical protein AAX25_01172 [Aliarcobacter thereius]OCL96166.1 hypothetical protein AA347_01657 [Aliarcobacter thereius LMG 24486]OCL99499.1 hypothetical protein AAX29_01313 [Aliarcobacter thereius]QBF15867.1 putative membrane protein [Aliarcobacter thereius LMG 24486]
MSTFDKIKAFCRPFRIVLGLVLIAIGIYTGIVWFYLGIIPLIVGIVNFCPLCLFTKKCELKNKKD